MSAVQCSNATRAIGGLAVVAFWRSPHGPLGSGLPRKKKEERKGRKGEKKEKKEGERKEKEKRGEEREEDETDMGRLFRV